MKITDSFVLVVHFCYFMALVSFFSSIFLWNDFLLLIAGLFFIISAIAGFIFWRHMMIDLSRRTLKDKTFWTISLLLGLPAIFYYMLIYRKNPSPSKKL